MFPLIMCLAALLSQYAYDTNAENIGMVNNI